VAPVWLQVNTRWQGVELAPGSLSCSWPSLSEGGCGDKGMKPPLGLQVSAGHERLTLLPSSEILDTWTVHHGPPTWWQCLSVLSEGSAMGRIAKLSSGLTDLWLTQHEMQLGFTVLTATDVIEFRIETGGCRCN